MIYANSYKYGLVYADPAKEPKLLNELVPIKEALSFIFQWTLINNQPEIFSINDIIEYYNLWETNLKSFKSSIVIKYEDLLSDPVTQFTNLVEFLNHKCTEQKLKEAIEFSSFENMKRIDNDPKKREDENINPLLHYKGQFTTLMGVRVRKGKHKAYLEEFSEWPEIIETIEEAKKKLVVKYD
tara:strand:- start:1072 stop:1620 length:549 start_codon:yes stop_codon:yes gene_type:complete